jgi:threonylcarbamoyladenosine tRNA methylthiotransferase MtaB
METLATTLAGWGHRIVTPGETADLCIFNSCTVTAMASRKSRQALRKLRRSNPDAIMVATGCYAEMEPDTVSALGIDLVIGNEDKDRLVEIMNERGLLRDDDPEELLSIRTGPDLHRRTRAFLKVQDGCDNTCAYCIVTIARGQGRSRPPEVVIDNIRQLLDAGFKEIILSGVHLGSFGHDRGDRHGLQNLVERLLKLGIIPRLRLSSLEPWDLSPAFFDLFTDPHLMPHIHLPLQSGCDATLKRMVRRTTQKDFANLIDQARRRVPDISISTDVMVGFPGETDAEFDQSIAFVKSMGFSHLHIFRFSIREGTAAVMMDNQVSGPVATRRSRQFHRLNLKLGRAFAQRFKGQKVEVLWETAEDSGSNLRWSGLTPHALRILTETPPEAPLFNQIMQTEILGPAPGGVRGHVAGISLPPIVEAQLERLVTIEGSGRRSVNS